MAHLYADMDPKTAAFILQLQRDELEAALSEDNEHDTAALELQLQELNLAATAHNDHHTTGQQAAVDRGPRKPAHSRNVGFFAGLFRIGGSIYQALFGQSLQSGATSINLHVKEQGDTHQPKSSFTCVACTGTLPWSDILETPCGHHYCVGCLSELFELSMQDETLYPPRCCRQTISLDAARTLLHPKLVRNFQQKSIELDTKDKTYCFDPRCSIFIPAEHITEDVAGCPGCGKRTCTICKAAAHRGDCPRDENLQQLLQTADAQGWQRCFSCRRIVDLRTGCNHITCPCGAQFCYVCGASWNPRTCNCPQWDEARLQERAEQIFARDPRHRLFRPPQGALDPGVDAAAAVPPVIPQDVADPAQPVHIPARPVAAADEDPVDMDYRDWIARQIERPPAQNAPVAPAAHPAAAQHDAVVPAPPIRHDHVLPEARGPAVPGAAIMVPVAAACPAAPDAAALSQQHLVAEIREDLRRNHECDHERWTCHRGAHRCEECNHRLPYYIFECRQCHIRACQRCRRNRL